MTAPRATFDDGTSAGAPPATSADVRQWAASEGIEFSGRGGIPAALAERFAAATGREYEPGPSHAKKPAGWSGPPGPAEPPEAEPPRQRAARPARISLRKAPARGKRPRPQVTADLVADVEGKLAAGAFLVGAAWERRDRYCGKAFLQVAPEAAAKFAPLICQSADMVAWFTSSGRYMAWFDALASLQPLLEVMWAHHVTREIGDPPDGKRPDEQPDYSAYQPGTRANLARQFDDHGRAVA